MIFSQKMIKSAGGMAIIKPPKVSTSRINVNISFDRRLSGPNTSGPASMALFVKATFFANECHVGYPRSNNYIKDLFENYSLNRKLKKMNVST